MESYATRTSCRICGSEELEPLFSLGNHYINNFVDWGQAYNGPRCPIELVACKECTLVQNPHTAPQELLYTGHYWYRSGVTDTMKNALKDVVDSAKSRINLYGGDAVLDIGSNDGTLLRNWSNNVIRIGVEPAKNFRITGKSGIELLIPEFWSSKAYFDYVGAYLGANRTYVPLPMVITACGMFYDLDDPNEFIKGVSEVLHPGGIFIAQLMCLKNMINVSDIGNLAHEHLEFYTLESLAYLLGKYGLEIFDIETNSVNGESYRLYIGHEGKRDATQAVIDAFASEQNILSEVTQFWNRMELTKSRVVEFINDEVQNRFKSVWVYGASTKGNTILQYYGLDDWLIRGAADRSPEKWGKYMIGSNIPIYSEKDAREAKPDYFLVLPYAFLNEFIEREAEWRAQGGKFIVPLPEFKVI